MSTMDEKQALYGKRPAGKTTTSASHDWKTKNAWRKNFLNTRKKAISSVGRRDNKMVKKHVNQPSFDMSVWRESPYEEIYTEV